MSKPIKLQPATARFILERLTIERDNLESAKGHPHIQWPERRQQWLDNLNLSVSELNQQL